MKTRQLLVTVIFANAQSVANPNDLICTKEKLWKWIMITNDTNRL